jgi:hypothetical protein
MNVTSIKNASHIPQTQTVLTRWENIDTNENKIIRLTNEIASPIISKNNQIYLKEGTSYKLVGAHNSFLFQDIKQLRLVSNSDPDETIDIQFNLLSNGKVEVNLPYIDSAKSDDYVFYLHSNVNEDIWESKNLHLYDVENFVNSLTQN